MGMVFVDLCELMRIKNMEHKQEKKKQISFAASNMGVIMAKVNKTNLITLD